VVVAAVNTLVDFCAVRDVEALTRDEVEARAGGRVDVAILFGGSILAGGDVFARAVTGDVAGKYLIVGGQGHSTEALRAGLGGRPGTEATLFDRYLRERYGIAVDLLEHESTNCGSNVRNTLALLAARGLRHDRILILQDATMQRRMDAGFRLRAPDVRVVNFASHRTHVELVGGEPGFRSAPAGMWAPDRYIEMLMGEVSRLTDDENGYGPAGRGFIAHVDVPDEVTRAHQELARAGFGPRPADQRWGSA
jgi:uncharacterized SAM-binding protein YcdF (DUF218 family)